MDLDSNNAMRWHWNFFTTSWNQKQEAFTPLESSVDGTMGKQTTAFVKRLATQLNVKWKWLFLRTVSHLKPLFAVSCVRASCHTISGSWALMYNISYILTLCDYNFSLGVHVTCDFPLILPFPTPILYILPILHTISITYRQYAFTYIINLPFTHAHFYAQVVYYFAIYYLYIHLYTLN